MIMKIVRFMARCEKCGRCLQTFTGSPQMPIADLIELLKKNNWKYNLKTMKCLCSGCKEDK